jgi:CRISPR-associated protein Cmr2
MPVDTAVSHNAALQIMREGVTAIAWCLAWGKGVEPQFPLETLQQMRLAIANGEDPPQEVRTYVQQAQALQTLTAENFPSSLHTLNSEYSELWEQQTRIGLVYGGATKIKHYVFDAARLPDIRGASALLDRINLVDLPAFFQGETSARFEQCQKANQTDQYCKKIRTTWLKSEHPQLSEALIPELIVYSTGGNILAFCPATLVDALSNAIEKRYTEETLTANSCAVGATFHLLETRLGLLQDPIENTFWLAQLKTHQSNPAVRAYFELDTAADQISDVKLRSAFTARKNFNELVGKLATQFNLRRSGFDANSDRPSRRYPPMLETHPYLRRDDSDRSSAVTQITELPSAPWVSEPLARKRRMGEVTKQESASERNWYERIDRNWRIQAPESWVQKFEQFLTQNGLVEHYDPTYRIFDEHQQIRNIHEREARSLQEISNDNDGFVAYIYADGNNMGQYIRDQIKTSQDYRQFSEDIFEATEQSVYHALAHHLEPRRYQPDAQSNRLNKEQIWIHPFEIVTIGGDDVLLIVPANRALAIAKMIGDRFESILEQKGRYPIQSQDTKGSDRIHRYRPGSATASKCCLSISSSVLITADNTPIYYADKLVSQLLKSAKKRAKDLKDNGYFGGTVDFLTFKAVTMISSNIDAFRKEGLTLNRPGQQLKLYAAPYTLHELGGLLKTVKAFKQAEFPRSQLYQIRSLLERGKRTAILNYRYFRVRLKEKQQDLLKTEFEAAWCKAETNNGNLAPWLTTTQDHEQTVYETLWRELVELYPFTDEPPPPSNPDVSGSEATTERVTP